MDKIIKRGFVLSLLALVVPACVLAAVQGSYGHENSAQTSYGTLQLKSLQTLGREPIIYGQLQGAIGSENSAPMHYSFYTSFYEDNEKTGRYYGIIPDVGELILTMSPEQKTVNLQVKGDIPKYFAANYRYNMKDVEFEEFAAIDLLQNASSAVTGLKGEYEVDVKDLGESWNIKANLNGSSIAVFDVSKNFGVVNRTDISPSVPVYTTDETNVSAPVPVG